MFYNKLFIMHTYKSYLKYFFGVLFEISQINYSFWLLDIFTWRGIPGLYTKLSKVCATMSNFNFNYIININILKYMYQIRMHEWQEKRDWEVQSINEYIPQHSIAME